MGKILAWTEGTFVDLTDGKQIQAYLNYNQPLTIQYDPNQAQNYAPDWGTNKLTITPVILVDNERVAPNANGMSIIWQRRVGSGSATNLVTGETVSSGVLNVSKNMMVAGSVELLSYICTITYTDPDTKLVAETQQQITFSLNKNALELSECSITGETSFKYNGSGKLVSASSIVLTANLTNCTLKQWQYKKADGSYAVYPSSGTSTTLTVKNTDAVFFNEVATIKLVTNMDGLIDIHQIQNVRDGAAGSDTYTCQMTNDVFSVSCTSSGTPKTGAFTGCDSAMAIWKGGNDDTANWNITATPSTGVTGSFDSDTHKYTVTGLTVMSGYVEFIATKTGCATITRRFNIHKDTSGADGKDAQIFEISSDVAVMKLNASDVYVPTSVKFSGTKRVGNATVAAAYSGRFKVYETTDGTTYNLKYTSSSDQTTIMYTPSSTSVKIIKAELYVSGNTTQLLDSQTVAVVPDGHKGETGAAGKDAVAVNLGNFHDSIPCDTGGKSKEARDITIPFECNKGGVRVAGTAAVGTLPSGVTLKTNTAATASADGAIVLTVAKDAVLSSTANSGEITITITAASVTRTFKFSWSKSVQALNGTSAVLLQAYPQGDGLIYNGNNNVVLQTLLQNGTTAVTASSYQWAKFTGKGYTNLEGKTQSTLTVTPDMVDSFASFRVSAVYGGKTYNAYSVVQDKTDPCTATLRSSIPMTIKNGQGAGGAWIQVLRNGVEIDAPKSTDFLTKAPSNPTSGDFYYAVNMSAKTVTLMKYDGSKWAAAPSSDQATLTYKWYRKNAQGESLDTTTPYATGKAIFVDSSVIQGTMSFDVEISEP